jgi:hypothetical protein
MGDSDRGGNCLNWSSNPPVTNRSIRASILPAIWSTSLDLADAYFHCPIYAAFRKYLRFVVDVCEDPKRLKREWETPTEVVTVWTGPVIDLFILNTYLVVPHFKMETNRSIRDSILPGVWSTSLDLADAYFHCPISAAFRKYLRLSPSWNVLIGKRNPETEWPPKSGNLALGEGL